jgi:xanthine dehydrogenase YagS FAD-binding subunit
MTAQPMRAEFRAGGTDLSERRRTGLSRGVIVDLIPDTATAEVTWNANGAAQIGALVTVETLASDTRLRAAYPGLAAAAAGLATPQIRAVATLGGNLAQRTRCWYFRNTHLDCLKKGDAVCSARAGNHLYGVAFDRGPCVAPHPSTLAAALLAYGATVTTSQRAGLSIEALLGDGADGARDNLLASDERISRVDLPVPLAGERAGYRRAISRTSPEWPLVEVVVRATISEERFTFVRMTAGGIAPVPLRFVDAEQALQSATADAANIRKAPERATANARPLPGTGYKLKLLEQTIIDMAEALIQP